MYSDSRFTSMFDDDTLPSIFGVYGNEAAEVFMDLFNTSSKTIDSEDSQDTNNSPANKEKCKTKEGIRNQNGSLPFPQIAQSNSAIQLVDIQKMNSPITISKKETATTPPIPDIRHAFILDERKIRSTEKFTEGKLRHISAPYDDEFLGICNNEKIILNPSENGFMPKKFWEKIKTTTFGWCLTNFFQKKNNLNTRFCFKLFNALQISQIYPELSKYVGVWWVNKKVIKVNKYVFGRLLGIKMVDNSFFHQQGNFPAHGFVEITHSEVKKYCPDIQLDDVDHDAVRLFFHSEGTFVQGCHEEDIIDSKFSKGKVFSAV